MVDRKDLVTYALVIMAFVFPTAPRALAAGSSSVVPPQFISPPIHAPEQVQQLIKGWLTFAASKRPGHGGGPPSSSPPPSADFPLTVESSSTPVDAVDRLDSYQGEPAITQIVTGLLVGGFNSIYPGACSAALSNCAPGATVSSDEGTRWVTSSVPIAGNLVGYDPSLSGDTNGAIYYGYGVCSGGCTSGNLMVATSTDGETWTGYVVTPPQGGVFDDKPWVAADPTQAGRVYMAWDRNKGNDQTILVSVSTDSGVTWSSPVKVNHGTSKFERVIYAMPTVDPKSGTVYVVWMDYARSELFVAKSTDHGTTWGSTDYAVAPLSITFTDIGCNGGRSMTPAPYIAVDDAGTVYVTYADKKGATGMDIYMTYSTSAGTSWSSSYRLNDDSTATDQYNPAMSVVGTGKVHVSWLDRRNDPNDCETQTYSTYTDGTFDANGVPNFSHNTQVEATNSDFDGNPNGPGDYTGEVAYQISGSSYATPFFPTHLQSDINTETGTAGGFECYTATVSP
jgi:hypothetical protein